MAPPPDEDQHTAESVSTRRALVFVYVGYVFRYLYLLILLPFYGRVLGAAEYGRLVAAMSLFQIVWMIVEYGFPAIGSRAVAAARDDGTRAGLYSRHVMGRLTMALPGLTVGVGGIFFSPLLRERPLFGVLACVNGLIAGFNLGWYFQGTLQFRTSVVIEVLGFAINLPLILLLVRGPEDGWLVMLSLCISSVICTSAAHVMALRTMQRNALRWVGAIALIRESTALFISRGLTMLMGSVSTYLISIFASATELGWYGAAERITSVGLSVMQPANQVLVGSVSQNVASEASMEKALSLIRKALLLMSALGLAMCCGVQMLAGFGVPLVLGPSFVHAVPMVRVMGLQFPFAAVTQVITSYVLIPFRYDRLIPIVSVATSIVTLGLILALGNFFGGIGVAWARAIGELGGMILVIIALRTTPIAKRVLSFRSTG